MKILITGADGQLGKTLIQVKPEKIEKEEISLISKNKKELDLSNEKLCKEVITQYKPDWIINCGAYTAVDKAESQRKLVNKINGSGPFFLAKYLNKFGGKMIQISTDFVFDGSKNKAYKVGDPQNPINVYGESKAISEKLLTNKESNFKNIFIIRTSWVVGNIGKNFFLTMLKLISEKEIIKVVNDQIGCITSLENLANACWQLIKLKERSFDIPKILHFSDSGICSWYDVSRSIYDLAYEKKLIINEPDIIPVESNFFNFPAKRPQFSLLNCQETYQVLQYTPTHWRKSLEILLNSLDSSFFEKI